MEFVIIGGAATIIAVVAFFAVKSKKKDSISTDPSNTTVGGSIIPTPRGRDGSLPPTHEQ